MKKEAEKSKYTLRFRAVNRGIFMDIKSGKKSVETRAASKKYGDIKAGDMLVLVCGKERFEKKVKKARVFKTISALLKVHPLRKIMPKLKSEKEWQEELYSYPGYKEKIKKFGLIALEL